MLTVSSPVTRKAAQAHCSSNQFRCTFGLTLTTALIRGLGAAAVGACKGRSRQHQVSSRKTNQCGSLRRTTCDEQRRVVLHESEQPAGNPWHAGCALLARYLLLCSENQLLKGRHAAKVAEQRSVQKPTLTAALSAADTGLLAGSAAAVAPPLPARASTSGGSADR